MTVLLPTLNEGQHLVQLLSEVRAAAQKLTDSFELLVIDGGSQDGTVAAAEAAGARVLRQQGRGFGQAIREGLAAAKGRWVLAMDADGSHPVRYFETLWSRRQACDLVIASRFVPGGGARMSWLRLNLSRLLNLVTRLVLAWPFRDSSSGLRLYRREAAAGLPLKAEDFSVQQEAVALILANGGRVEEVPFLYELRRGGLSKADILLLARRYPRMLLRLRRLRGGWSGPAALAGVLALGLAAGLWGIHWGLPGPARWRAFPEGWRGSPEVAQRLTESWQRLYAGIEQTHKEVKGEEPVTRVQGVEEVPPGWSWPPDKLANSYRSWLVRSENPDEQKVLVMLSRMRPWRLEFEPLYLHYGGGFIYPLGAFLATAKLLHLARLSSGLGYYLLHPADMGRLYLLGRLFVLLFQLGALWVLYDLGRRLSGPLTGFCAAAFYCLCPFAMAQSHTAKPHPYSAFWAIAAIRYLFLAFEDGTRKRYLLAGLCLGMAAGANSSFACLAFLPLLAWLLGGRRQSLWSVLLAPVLAGAVYAVTNPYIFIATRDFLWETTVYPGGAPVLRIGGSLVSLLGPWSLAGLGPGLYCVMAAGLLCALFGRDPRRRMLGLTWACGFGVLWLFLARFWGFLNEAGLRFFLPFYGLAALLAADAVCSSRIPRWLKAAVLAAVFADCGARSWVHLQNFHLDAGPASTREQAADWIDSHVPAGAAVGLARYPQPAHTPPFRFDRYHLVVFEKPELLDARRAPDFVVIDAASRPSLEGPLLGSYRLEQAMSGYRLGWAGPEADTFANAGFFIYRRARPSSTIDYN